MGYLELAKKVLREAAPKPLPPILEFNQEEWAMIRHLPPGSLESLRRVKQIFGGRVVDFKPLSVLKPLSEQELKHQEMQEHLKEKCRIRGALMADLGRILTERKKGRKRSKS